MFLPSKYANPVLQPHLAANISFNTFTAYYKIFYEKNFYRSVVVAGYCP